MASLLQLQLFLLQSKGGKGSQQHRQRKSEEVTAHGKKSKREKQREKQAKKVGTSSFHFTVIKNTASIQKAKGKGKGQPQKKRTQSHTSKPSDSSEDEVAEEVQQQQQVETDQVIL